MLFSRQSRLLAGSLLVGVVIIAAVHGCRSSPRQPSYSGKTLSQWLRNGSRDFVWIPNDVYGHIHDELWRQLVTSPGEPLTYSNALAARLNHPLEDQGLCLDTNAIPWLIQWMEVRPTGWDRLNEWLGARLPSAVAPRVLPYSGTGAAERSFRWHIAAFEGFRLLRTNAEPALLSLSNLARRTGGDLPLTWAMANIGPAGIAVLTNLLASTNAVLRDNAALALGLEYEKARTALPALVDCIERGQAGYHVLGAVGRTGGDDPRLVPALTGLLASTNLALPGELDESMALLVLGLKGYQARPAVPVLVARYYASSTNEPALSRRLLRRVIKTILPSAEQELPPPGPTEASSVWP